MPGNDVADAISAECAAIEELLISKNKSYGNSALDPVGIFSKATVEEQLFVRIDDKLKRLRNGQEYAGDDTVLDLIGYFILLRVHRRLTVPCADNATHRVDINAHVDESWLDKIFGKLPDGPDEDISIGPSTDDGLDALFQQSRQPRRNCIPVEDPHDDHSASLASACAVPELSDTEIVEGALRSGLELQPRVYKIDRPIQLGNDEETPDWTSDHRAGLLAVVKPKRKRRTKAEMAAARAAEKELLAPDTVRPPPVLGADVEEELGIPEALIGDGMREQLIELGIAGFLLLRSEVSEANNAWEILVSRAPKGWFAAQLEHLDL